MLLYRDLVHRVNDVVILFHTPLGALADALHAMTYDTRGGTVTVVYRSALSGSVETYLESAGQRTLSNAHTFMQERQYDGLLNVVKATLTYGLRFRLLGAVHDHNNL